ncbi:hypothetical protein AgCh_032086 [Apium graveolens]
MYEISLDDEEEGVIALREIGGQGDADQPHVFDTKLCLVGKFLTEYVFDFPAIQHTMTTLWKPEKGVYIKALDANLFLFQFDHEIDLKRVIEAMIHVRKGHNGDRKSSWKVHKFYSKLFEIPESEIQRPFGAWMRAPLSRNIDLVGSKWLRNGTEKMVTRKGTPGTTVQAESKRTIETGKLVPDFVEMMDSQLLQQGNMMHHNQEAGVKSGISKIDNQTEGGKMNAGFIEERKISELVISELKEGYASEVKCG